MLPWLFANTLLAALLGLVAWAVWKTTQNPRAAHALWVAALVKLITPPLLSIPLAWAPLGDPPGGPANASAYSTAAQSFLLELPRSNLADPGGSALGPEFKQFISGNMLLWVWLSGSGLFFLVAGIRILRFQRSLDGWRAAPREVQQEARQIARRLGLERTPPVLVSGATVSPAVWAVAGSPRVLLPAGLLSRLGRRGRRTLLAHELAHVRRGDHWIRLFECLVTGVLWWHPLVWLVRRGIRESEELCCDALVVKTLPDSASSYAPALLEVVDFLATEAWVPLRVGLAPVRMLERRIKMIAKNSFPGALPVSVRALLFCLVLLILPLSGAAAVIQEPTPPVESQEKEQEPPSKEELRERLREAMASVSEALAKVRNSPELKDTLAETRQELRKAMEAVKAQQGTIRENLRQSLDKEKILGRVREALEQTRLLSEEERERIQESLSGIEIDEIVEASLEASMSAIEAIDIESLFESVMSAVDIESIVQSSLKAVEEALSRMERERTPQQN